MGEKKLIHGGFIYVRSKLPVNDKTYCEWQKVSMKECKVRIINTFNTYWICMCIIIIIIYFNIGSRKNYSGKRFRVFGLSGKIPFRKKFIREFWFGKKVFGEKDLGFSDLKKIPLEKYHSEKILDDLLNDEVQMTLTVRVVTYFPPVLLLQS